MSTMIPNIPSFRFIKITSTTERREKTIRQKRSFLLFCGVSERKMQCHTKTVKRVLARWYRTNAVSGFPVFPCSSRERVSVAHTVAVIGRHVRTARGKKDDNSRPAAPTRFHVNKQNLPVCSLASRTRSSTTRPPRAPIRAPLRSSRKRCSVSQMRDETSATALR